MALNQLTIVSGTSSDEQGVAVGVNNALVHVFGWEQHYEAGNTSGDRDWWYRSEGETPERYMTLYGRVEGTGDYINMYGATYVNEGTGTASDQIFDNADHRIYTQGQAMDYWVVGNKDCVYVAIQRSSNTNQLAGIGYFETLYDYEVDPYPLYVFGQQGDTSKFSDTDRLDAYLCSAVMVAHGGGVSGGPFLGTIASGVSGPYRGQDNNGILSSSAPSPYDDRYTAIKPLFYRSSGNQYSEVRGMLPFLWQIYGDVANTGAKITSSGVLYDGGPEVTDSTFFVFGEDGEVDNSYLIGPIQEYDLTDQKVPQSISNLELYLMADKGIVRNGGSFRGGRVSDWRDQHRQPGDSTFISSERNDASQGTAGNQPTPIESVINDKPIVRFDSAGSHNMTGTIDVDNDMTIFAVASYADGTSQAPVFSVRGDISATDTMFTVQFNENSNNSATIVNIAGGGTDREEITGLSEGTMYILTNTVSGTDSTLYLNGWSGDSSTITDTKGTTGGSATDLNYYLGVDQVSGGSIGTNFADVDVAEVIVYDRILTTEELQDVWCMLYRKYGITVSGTC